MTKNFFVMMNSQDQTVVMPIVNDIGDVEMWETAPAAHLAMVDHVYCHAFGYEVFERGTGASR